MKKIAYLGFSYVQGTMKRALAYVLANPEFSHTFITIDDCHEFPQYDFKGHHVEMKRLSETKNDFDIILIMTDKAFDAYLNYRGIQDVKNVCDKITLDRECKAAGIQVPKTEGFNDTDYVIIKPRLSSGNYSKEDFCYKKMSFARAKRCLTGYNPSEFIVQEFIESDHVIQFNFLSNGEILADGGVTDFQFVVEVNQTTNPIYNTCYPSVEKYCEHVKVFNNKVETIRELQKLTRDFLYKQKYNTLPGFFYQFQFIHKDGQFYGNDCNLRIGPGSIETSLHNLYENRFFTSLKFMLKMVDYESLPHDTNFAYSFYTERNGQRLTHPDKLLVEDYDNRVKCSENKSSGFLRNDCETYIQATRI